MSFEQLMNLRKALRYLFIGIVTASVLCFVAVRFFGRPDLRVLLGLPALPSSSSGYDVIVPPAQASSVVGRVRSKASGCWNIETVYGSLQILNLDEQFRVDGLRLVVSFTTPQDIQSICMTGWPIRVTSVRRASNE